MAAARHAMGGKPVFAVLQTFYEPGGKMPTRAELRNMTYLSVVRGVTGILYFAFKYGGPPMPQRDPDTWADLKQLAGEFRTLAPVFLSDPPSDATMHHDGGTSIASQLYRHAGAYYVLAVNQHDRPTGPVRFTLSIAGDRHDAALSAERLLTPEGDGHNKTVPIHAGAWSEAFEAYGVWCYKVAKEE